MLLKLLLKHFVNAFHSTLRHARIKNLMTKLQPYLILTKMIKLKSTVLTGKYN
jgi:serine kinase of HPr protein (carbohydrate metabolism regulator)